jgi:hypothetical protein
MAEIEPVPKSKRMKNPKLSLVTLVTVVLFISGCATENYKNSVSTAAALNQSSEMIATGNLLIDLSLANLNGLVSHPGSDLRQQFKAFSASVHDLSSTARDTANKAVEMKSRGATYFARWDEESAKMRNEDIRTRSEDRRNEVALRFDRISRQYDATKISFEPFMSDLRDVQRFLATDLTAGGLSAIKDVSEKANRDAVPLKASMAKLSVEFQGLGVAMSPTTK